MEKTKENTIFKILSRLMDERTGEDDLPKNFNELRIIVEEKLIPSIERVQYDNKYELIEAVRDICRDISLYLFFPELINQKIIGFHRVDDRICTKLCPYFFEGRLMPEADSIEMAVSEAVPTMIHAYGDNPSIKALNLAEKVISLSDQEYWELLNYARAESMDLSGLLHGISIPSEAVNVNQAYVVIPEQVNPDKKYYSQITGLIDVLVIRAKECTVEKLKQYPNISAVLVYGEPAEAHKGTVEEYCEKQHIAVQYFYSFPEIFQELKEEKYRQESRNFCYKYCLENILYEIAGYLSDKKIEWELPMADINDNLLYKDDITSKYVKNLQRKYGEAIGQVRDIYNNYIMICDELVDKVEAIQHSFDMRENENYINRHIKLENILLDLILKLSETYRGFPEEGGRERLRI